MMGWEKWNISTYEDRPPIWDWHKPDDTSTFCQDWAPSKSWDQAALVIEWMKGQGFTDCQISLSSEGAIAWFGNPEWVTDDLAQSVAYPTGKADNGPEAICRAALEAMGCPTS